MSNGPADKVAGNVLFGLRVADEFPATAIKKHQMVVYGTVILLQSFGNGEIQPRSKQIFLYRVYPNTNALLLFVLCIYEVGR